MKIIGRVLLLAALGVAAHADAADSAASRRALLIGVSKYANHDPLQGASGDVQLMRRVLIGRFNFQPGEIRVLADKDANRDNVRNALKAIAKETTSDGLVIVHFSGYGSQLPDDGSEELDGLDETLVLSDSAADGSDEMRDEELDEFLAPIAGKTSRLTLILDTCYVANASRGGTAGRCIARENDYRRPMMKGSSGLANADASRERARYDLLIASQSQQVANEAVLGPAAYGVFTYELATALINLPGAPTFQSVCDRVLARVRTRFPTQEPKCSLRDPKTPVFHAIGINPEFVITASPAEKGMTALSAGLFQGIELGARLDVFPAGTRDYSAAKPIAVLEVTQVGALTSWGRLATGRAVPAGSIARRPIVSDVPRLSVWLETGDAGRGAELARLKQRLRTDRQMAVVEKSGDAQLQVVARDNGFAILSGDLTPLKVGIETASEVNSALNDLVRWFAVLRCSNPGSSLSIDVVLRRAKSSEALQGTVRPGEVVEYTVTNTSQRMLYVHTLILSSNGTINAALAKPVPLEKQATFTRRLGTFLTDDLSGVTDYIKVFAAATPLDVGMLMKADVNADQLKKTDWTSQQVSYQLRRQVLHVSSYAVHLKPDARSVDSRSADQSPTLCGKDGKCFSARSLDAKGSLVVIDAASGRTTQDDARPGTSFQQAYELREQLDADRVEPLFDVALGADLPGLEGRSGGGADNDPAAASDKMWSLNYVNAPNAWATVQRDLARPAGREAQGIRIAHLDTGYREHPELFYKDKDYSTVLPSAGFDLVDEGDPYDTLSTIGAFPNPGHGTASGSVIVSAKGCQLAGGEQPCVTGVAPGAQLVPVRVNTSVIVLNQRRLAEAIMGVVRGRAGETRVIAIAMGGPPSWTLSRAVDAAERAGIIVVAAAGNNVGLVVWPARFDSVVAAGAINVRCRPWSGSSHGSRVDISAPGESVWRAQIDREMQKDIIGMGSGTTFATAITAGAAALWVAKHQAEAEFKELARTGRLTAAFRRAIQETAWRPVTGDANRPKTYCEDNVGWKPDENGAGILNIDRMLAYPLASLGGRAAERGTNTLPLFETLYSRDVPLETVVSDYRQLFAPDNRGNIEQFEAEILFFYASNDVVRSAVDRIVAGARNPVDYLNAGKALLRADISEPLKQRLQQ